METSDFELDKTVLCRAVGKAISNFVSKTGTTSMTISAICDKPAVTFDDAGTPYHGINIRVYIDINEEDYDDE